MINNANYWDSLYKKYTTKYGDDHTKAVSALIYDNIKDWQKTKLVDISTTYGLIFGLENATDHSYALMLRTIYEIMEHTEVNLYRFGIRCGDMSPSARIEVINGSIELNSLLNIHNHDTTDLITAICRNASIQNAYEMLVCVMSSKNNDLRVYSKDPIYKALFKMLFVYWDTLPALMDTSLEPQEAIMLFKNINLLCQNHIKNWMTQIDVICETEENKWKFLIGWHTLSLSPLLHYIDKNDMAYIEEVTKLGQAQIESEFNIDIHKLNVLETLFDLTNLQLHTKKVESFKTLKQESCELPEML